MKRALDIIVSFIAIILFSPITIITGAIVFISLGNPIIFSQKRVGKDKSIFKLYKFRSMNNKKDMNNIILPDHQRLNKTGYIIRSLSLDELPSLWNVLKGDMSLVGPRPLLVEYLPLYTTEQNRRHKLKPGITGWAQINGRNSISWEEKFKLDVWYVDNQSFLLDIKILFLTIKKVLARENISSAGEATTKKFTGSK